MLSGADEPSHFVFLRRQRSQALSGRALTLFLAMEAAFGIDVTVAELRPRQRFASARGRGGLVVNSLWTGLSDHIKPRHAQGKRSGE